MSRYDLNEVRVRNVHDAYYRAVRPLLEAVAPSSVQEVIAVRLYDALRAAGHYPRIDQWREPVVALATGGETVADLGEGCNPDAPPTMADLLRDFPPFLPTVEALPWRAGDRDGDVQQIFVGLKDVGILVRINRKGADDYEYHGFDYADPRCFDRLAAVLAGCGVGFDVGAVA